MATAVSSDIIALGTATAGAIGANSNFFSTSLSPQIAGGGRSSIITLTISLSVSATIDVSLDNASHWSTINNGASFTAGQVYTLNMRGIRSGDLINFRTTTGGGTTIVFFRVDEAAV